MSYKWAVMFCLLPAFTVATIDLTIVNVALAKLAAVFGVDVATVGWAVTAFALAMGVATPLASYVEARLTTKRLWVLALVLFTGGSLLCGLAPAFWVLIVGRLVQGVAVGIFFPVSISVLFRVFPAGERGGAMGLMAIPMVAGPAFGPTIGGYIVTYLDWRVIFFMNLPIGLLAVLAAILLLRPSHPEADAPFDAVGAVLSTLGFGLSLYGLSRVSQDGWSSLSVQWMLGLGGLSLVALCAFEATHDHPLIDVRLFALPQFLIGNVVTSVGAVALMGAEFMLPLYLQNLRGLTALDAGLLLMPQGFAVALSSPIAGKLIDKVGARYVAIFGILLLTVNTWDLSHITLDTSLDTLRWLLVIRGLALGFVMAPPKLTAMEAAPEHLRTNASSLLSAMQSVSQSLGVALLATMVQTQAVVHATILSWQVRPGTPPGEAIAQLTALFRAHGLSSGTAHVAAVETMAGQIAQQASVFAFGDAYRVTFFAAIVAAMLAILLPGRVKATQPTLVES